MVAVWSSLGVGRVTAGLTDAVIAPRVRGSYPVAVYLAGVFSDSTEMVGASTPAVRPHMTAIARAGFVCVAPTVTTTWGNATTTARVDAAVAWARSEFGGSSAPPVLVGASHGGACALVYASTHDVSALVGLVPCVDVGAVRAANTLELQDDIDTAWGVTYPTALPSGANPIDLDPGCPTQFWYATDDPISVNIEGYGPSIGADMRSVGALGHTNAAIAAADSADIVLFVEAHT